MPQPPTAVEIFDDFGRFAAGQSKAVEEQQQSALRIGAVQLAFELHDLAKERRLVAEALRERGGDALQIAEAMPDERANEQAAVPQVDWPAELVPRGAQTRIGDNLKFIVEKERGGPIAAVQNGDIITIDIPNRDIRLELTDEEIQRLRAKVGDVTMNNELLLDRCHRLEAGLPPALRRPRA